MHPDREHDAPRGRRREHERALPGRRRPRERERHPTPLPGHLPPLPGATRKYTRFEDAINVPSSYSDSDGANRLDVDFRVWYRGTKYIDETHAIDSEGDNELLDLKRAGVYRIAARGKDGEWVTRTVVVTDPNKTVTIDVGIDGSIREIEVKPPWGYR